MQTKMRVSIDRTEINVTREKASGKKLILQKISWRNLVKIGWKQREMHQKKQSQKKNGITEKRQVVKFFLKPDREKTNQRMCLPEHPFGTIKRAMGATYFLLKGMRKVAGEFVLFCLGYNLEETRIFLDFYKMWKLMGTGISLFLNPVYFIQFSMTQIWRKGINLCLKIKSSDRLRGLRHDSSPFLFFDY